MKTRFSIALALLLMVVQGVWGQTALTKSGDNSWTAPMPAYNIVLHADYWGEFAISYDLNGGTNHAQNPAIYYEDEAVVIQAPTKKNYTFLGWTGSNGETPQTEVTIAQGSTGDKNFVANWQLTDPEGLKLDLLQELWTALGEDVWTGYGANTGVISYSRGTEPQSFHASFMGGTYAFDLPFAAFTAASKADQGNGEYLYTLTCNLPAQTGMGQETLTVLVKNGTIEGIHSDNAQIDMTKEAEITGWAALQTAMNAGGMIKLTANVNANGEAALVVPAGKTVVLDLNDHIIDRGLANAEANGSVIVNNGTLAIMGGGVITGGKTTGNGGGILNNGILTLYNSAITGNAAAIGGGVYSTENAQFWMTAGLIMQNEATSYPAIGGDVTFNAQAVVQIDAEGTKISIANALAELATLTYIKPVMPNYDDLQPADPEALKLALLQELYDALGTDIWTGYGVQTGVISYSRGTEPQSFHASFMGGTYAFDLPFAAFTAASKEAGEDGVYTYTLTCNLPAQTGMGQETLHVTLKNGEIEGLHSDNAGIDMSKEEEITGWAALQAAFAKGGVIKLAENVTATAEDAALTVPADKTVMLELNGHIINRALTSAVENGSVIINNGTLAIMDTEGGKIIGGKTTGNGGGILNNGILTLYAGTIEGNHAAIGGGVFSKEGAEFWMTGGLIKANEADSYAAISGEVIFNSQAVVQIDAEGTKIKIEEALAQLASLTYVQPAMPSYDDLQPADPEALKLALLQELWVALGEDVWTGYGVNTGVISYSRGGEKAFHASFMGGNYAFDLPFAAFTEASKAANVDGSYTYTLTCNLPAQTGLDQETLHVTLKNGEITGLESENAGIDMSKETDEPLIGWAALKAAVAQGGVIKLSEDVTAGGEDEALVVPEGKTVLLELNGHVINRALESAVENGSVIINNGTLAIMGEGTITGGKTTGNGGAILNNGTLTLYAGEITGNHAALGGGVYNTVLNTATTGFWMTGGLIDGNTADSHPAIGGDVTFNAAAVIQIDVEGHTVDITTAIAGLANYDYVKPVMPAYEDLPDPTPDTPTDICDPDADSTKPVKVIRDNLLYIIRDGKTYNVVGATVR